MLVLLLLLPLDRDEVRRHAHKVIGLLVRSTTSCLVRSQRVVDAYLVQRVVDGNRLDADLVRGIVLPKPASLRIQRILRLIWQAEEGRLLYHTCAELLDTLTHLALSEMLLSGPAYM